MDPVKGLPLPSSSTFVNQVVKKYVSMAIAASTMAYLQTSACSCWLCTQRTRPVDISRRLQVAQRVLPIGVSELPHGQSCRQYEFSGSASTTPVVFRDDSGSRSFISQTLCDHNGNKYGKGFPEQSKSDIERSCHRSRNTDIRIALHVHRFDDRFGVLCDHDYHHPPTSILENTSSHANYHS